MVEGTLADMDGIRENRVPLSHTSTCCCGLHTVPVYCSRLVWDVIVVSCVCGIDWAVLLEILSFPTLLLWGMGGGG